MVLEESSLTCYLSQLWDVCSDQEAVDLIRNIQDPQPASKALVDHALARFSTDNLSCMVVRFDNQALQHNQETNLIGVDGDPSTNADGISEATAIVNNTKNHLDGNGAPLSEITTNDVMEDVKQNQEAGPELNPSALDAARKDVKPTPEEMAEAAKNSK